MPPKRIPPSEQKHTALVVDQLKDLRDNQFGENMSALARALGFTNAYVGNVINGHRGIGLAIVVELARVKKCSLAAVLGETWSDDPRWPPVVAEVRVAVPLASDAALEWLGSLSGPRPPGNDPHVLGQIALAWDQAQAKTAAKTRAVSPSAAASAAPDTPTVPTPTPKKPKHAA